MGVWVLQNKELPDTETCQALLDRILSSSQLKRSTRMRDLLAYVGRRALEDGCEQLHEQEIGTEVFGRPAGYDTSVDNIVRVNATELRKRIDAYFESPDGRDETLAMEIPRGSYIPVFRYRPVESPMAEVPPPVPAIIQELAPDPVSIAPIMADPLKQDPPRTRRWAWLTGAVAAGIAVLALAAVCVHLWMQNRAMHEQLNPWQSEPAVASLWTGFLTANSNTDLVLPDTGFGVLQTISNRYFSLQEYLNRSYVNKIDQSNLDPQVRSALAKLSARPMISWGGFSMAQRLASMQPLGKRIHLYFARNYMPALFNRDNVILFGTRRSNPWMQLFENRLAFVVERNPNLTGNASPETPEAVVADHAPASGEQPIYVPSGGVGYCTAAYLPNPQHTGRVVLIEGTSSEAAQGCGEFLLSEPSLSTLQAKLGTAEHPYFQVLLRTSQLIDTPIGATVVAYRSFPNLR